MNDIKYILFVYLGNINTHGTIYLIIFEYLFIPILNMKHF